MHCDCDDDDNDGDDDDLHSVLKFYFKNFTHLQQNWFRVQGWDVWSHVCGSSVIT